MSSFRTIQLQHEAKRPPEDTTACPECGEDGPDNWSYYAGYAGSREEPAECGGIQCRNCGEWMEEPDDDGRADYEMGLFQDRELEL